MATRALSPRRRTAGSRRDLHLRRISNAPTVAGSYAVVATINDPGYRGTANGTLVIAKAAQSISFPSIPAQLATASVNLAATGGASGNPVTFSVTDGPGQVAGTTLSFGGAGTVQVTASQAGDANHEAATRWPGRSR